MKEQIDKKNKDKHNIVIFITTMCTIFTMACTVLTTLNTFKISTLQEQQYNISTYTDKQLECIVSIDDSIKGTATIHNRGAEDLKLDVGAITVSAKIGGISKVYGVNYYENECWAIEPVELYETELLKEYSSQENYYALTEYTLDCIATKGDHWYSTYFLLVEDYQGSFTTRMLVFEFSNNSLYDLRIYDDIQLQLYENSSNLEALHSFDYDQLNVYKSFLTKVKSIN